LLQSDLARLQSGSCRSWNTHLSPQVRASKIRVDHAVTDRLRHETPTRAHRDPPRQAGHHSSYAVEGAASAATTRKAPTAPQRRATFVRNTLSVADKGAFGRGQTVLSRRATPTPRSRRSLR